MPLLRRNIYFPGGLDSLSLFKVYIKQSHLPRHINTIVRPERTVITSVI